MLTYYLRLSLRQLQIAPGSTLINLLGLTLGLSACYIILIYTTFLTSFDRYNDKLDRLYLLTTESSNFGWVQPSTPLALGSAIKEELPVVEAFARYNRLPVSLELDGQQISGVTCAFSDPNIFDLLTFPLVAGDLKGLRPERDFLVISEALANRYFPNQDPVGKTITVECVGGTYALKVQAVMKDIPITSTFSAEAIGPFYIAENFVKQNWGKLYSDPLHSWDVRGTITYALLREDARKADADRLLSELSRRLNAPGRTTIYHFFPLADVYFHSASFVNNRFPTGSLSQVYIYSAAAIILLTIACVNYLLLILGRASVRTKEVGIRRVFGAKTSTLAGQMIVEATLLALISLPLALSAVELLLPAASALFGMPIPRGHFHSLEYLLAFFLIAVGVGTIAGGYVSLYLSRLTPTDILGNRRSAGTRKPLLRKILMATQMIIVMGFTFSSIIIHKQLKYFLEKDPGFSPTELLFIYPGDRETARNYEAIKNELNKIPGVISVTGGNNLPGSEGRAVSKYPRKDNPKELVTVEAFGADRDVVATLGFELIEGVSFSDRPASGAVQSCLINETAKKELGLTTPIGTSIGGITVIGVVRDFMTHSFREKIVPIIIWEDTRYINELALRVDQGKLNSVRKSIDNLTAKFNNGTPMKTEFYNERIAAMYVQERNFGTVTTIATAVSILIAALGIFGMSIFVCRTRMKEIGIRKVLGASIWQIYILTTKEFVLLVLASAFVAIPVAHYLTAKWLQQFVNAVRVGLWDVLIVITLNMTVVLMTVSVYTLRAATMKPVQSIRYE